MPVGFSNVEDSTDVAMLNGAAQAQLAGKPSLPLGVAGELGLEDLQGDDILRGPVEDAQHDPAPPLPMMSSI